MKYNFDEIIPRKGTGAFKHDGLNWIYGKDDLTPLWVADMDFKTPDFILDAIKERLNHEILGYTLRPEGFFTSLMSWVEKRHGWKVEKDWICFSPGVVSACTMTVMALTNPGDKIIVQPPVYFPFFSVVKDTERELLLNELIEVDGRYTMNFKELEEQANAGAKMLILCSPHNPTATVWNTEELEKLAAIAEKYDLLILSDEIHSDLILMPAKHIPLASLNEKIAKRTITTLAPSKTFNVAGMSTSSLIISNEALREKYLKTLDTIHIGLGNIFGNIAFEAAYSKGEEWLEELLTYLSANIDYTRTFLQKHLPEIKLIEPEATYLLWLDCKALNLDDEQLKQFMIDAGIAFNDGPMFGKGGSGFQRMNVACPLSVVQEGLEKLKTAIEKHRPTNE